MGWYVSKQHTLEYVLMYVWFITIVGATEAERKKRELQFDSDILM
jgi:hypothetical protein